MMEIPKKRKEREKLLRSCQKPNGEWNVNQLKKLGIPERPRRGWDRAFIQYGEDWDKYV